MDVNYSLIKAPIKASSWIWLSRTSVLYFKPKANSYPVSKSLIGPSVSESCSGWVTLVDFNIDLQADWPSQTPSQLSRCVNRFKSGGSGPSITPDLLEPSNGFSDVFDLVGPVWPSRSKSRQVWNLTAILAAAEVSSAQEGNKTRRVRSEKLGSAVTFIHNCNLHHQICPVVQLCSEDYIIFKTSSYNNVTWK